MLYQEFSTRGSHFYPTYRTLMKSHGHLSSITPSMLVTDIAQLALIGAPNGQIDGSALIKKASERLQLSLFKMIRDANGLIQILSSISVSGIHDKMELDRAMTNLINSFTEVLIASAGAGYAPDWFEPEDLVEN